MEKLNIKLTAYPGAKQTIFSEGETIISKVFPRESYRLESDEPDVFFVLTGGSEMEASELIKNQKYILIIAFSANNSYAAASEIKSYTDNKGINSTLINIDYDDLKSHLEVFHKVKNTLIKFKDYKLGLVGNVSKWLINSEIQSNILKKKFGINLKKVASPNKKSIKDFEVNESFISHFSGSHKFNLSDSSRVYSLLDEVIEKNEFDAITVECFPLVKEQKVTACLSLSKFMDDGIPAGCEGDITSIIGMILSKELLGIIPWMANLISVNTTEVLFAHCTIATHLLESYMINTHFESNEGTAIQGKFKSKDATVFRLDAKLEKAFISYGQISEIPFRNDACRTQVKINIPEEHAEILKVKPLGNHHIIIPGNFLKELDIMCKYLNIIPLI